MHKTISLVVTMLALTLAAVTAFAGTVELPQTRQTTCYDSAGNVIACSGTGQDGDLQSGAAWPSPRFTDNADGTVTDNLTGLMWLKDANCIATQYPVFDTDGTAGDGKVTWQHALDFVAGINSGTYSNCGAGYTDWRLSNVNELESLANANESDTAAWLNTQGFINMQSRSYWSSTTYNTDYAWIVYMEDVSVYSFHKYYSSSNKYVWPVRSGQSNYPDTLYPANVWKTGQTTTYYSGDDGNLESGVAWPNPRFTVNGDCVTDNLTGLMWTKNGNLAGYTNWQQAIDYANNLNLCGYYDWHLPNRKELQSLIDYSIYNPALPITHPFVNVQSFFYWTSTTYGYYLPDYAWVVDMWDGTIHYDYKVLYDYYVWPVRSGPGLFDYYCDNDGDEHVDSSIDGTCTGDGCVPSGCQPTPGNDCDDNDTAINPGATEIPCNGKDDDCNSSTGDGGVDLYVSSMSASGSANSGNTISVSDTTNKSGACTSGASTTKIYLSTDNKYGTSDIYLGERAVSAFGAKAQNSSGSTSITIPSNACTQTYYLIARADADKIITEWNEGNNNRAIAIGITNPTPPPVDLYISSITTPGSATAGETISVSDTTNKSGPCTSGASTTKIYLSTDNKYSTSDIYLGERAVSAFGAGAGNNSGSTNVTIPSGTPVGSYYIIARADADKVIPEWNEGNNNRAGAFTVMVTVPNVFKMPQAAAESAITTANLTVGTVTTANSDTVPAGSVISQNPAANTSVPLGSAVDLVVSLGPVMVAEAGPRQIVSVGDTVALDGSSSSNTNGNTLIFNWSFISIPDGSGASLSNPAAVNPTFTADLPGTYLVQLTVSDGLLLSASDVVTITTRLAQLPGPPGDAANDHIPDIEFPDPLPEDIVAPSGIPISVRDLIVIFKDTATVSDVNALLQSLPAEIFGGIPEAHLLLIRLTGASDLDRVLTAQQTLLESPLIVAATINTGYTPNQLPPHNIVSTPNDRWTWEVPIKNHSGNWGLKKIRMPQAWNLVDYAERVGKKEGVKIDVAVLEAAGSSEDADNAVYASHFDLSPRVETILSTSSPSDHATMVGGIIGAIWNDNSGVEGVYPRNLTIVSVPAKYFGAFIGQLLNIILNKPTVKVINYSVGKDYTPKDKPPIDPVTDTVNPTKPQGPNNPTWRKSMNNQADALLASLQVLRGFGREDFLVMCGAGNLRLRPKTNIDYEARDSSPCANIAVRGANPEIESQLPNGGAGADHFLAIEATDSNDDRASFSASYGTLSAPGVCIRSSEYPLDANYDNCATGGDNGEGLDGILNATQSGTSFSSPMAAGLAAFLWSLAPERPYTDIRRAMTEEWTTMPAGLGSGGGATNGSRRIDAFAAAMDLDNIRGFDFLQRSLVDVDDGTLDGNQRTTRGDDDSELSDYMSIDTPDKDGRRGDGKISMADFRAFRDAMTQVLLEEGLLNDADVLLDGITTHPKKDLNMDGCVGTEKANPPHYNGVVPVPPQGCAAAPKENVFPRYDFNGDGKISTEATATGVSPILRKEWKDLEVLQEVWPTYVGSNEGWTANDLRDLLPGIGFGSGDIEFRTNIPLGGTNQIDRIEITIEGLPMTRTISDTDVEKRLVWTVPRDLSGTTAVAKGIKGSNETKLCFNRSMPIKQLKHGKDTVVTIGSCTTDFYVVKSLVVRGREHCDPCGSEPCPDFPQLSCSIVGLDYDYVQDDTYYGYGETETSGSINGQGPSACSVGSSSYGEGTVSPGNLSALAKVRVTWDPSAQNDEVCGARAARGESSAGFLWHDTLTVMDPSGTYLAGDPVDLQINVAFGMHPIVEPSTFQVPGGAGVSGVLSVMQTDPATGKPMYTFVDLSEWYEDSQCGSPGCYGPNHTVEIQTSVGAKIVLEASLNTGASASTNGVACGWDIGYCGLSWLSSVSAQVTANMQFYVDPLTPGVSYTSASGQTYFSP